MGPRPAISHPRTSPARWWSDQLSFGRSLLLSERFPSLKHSCPGRCGPKPLWESVVAVSSALRATHTSGSGLQAGCRTPLRVRHLRERQCAKALSSAPWHLMQTVFSWSGRIELAALPRCIGFFCSPPFRDVSNCSRYRSDEWLSLRHPDNPGRPLRPNGFPVLPYRTWGCGFIAAPLFSGFNRT